MRIGSVQKRDLIALAQAPNGIGEVPFSSAPGLKNRGLVEFVGRTSSRRNSSYVCQITQAGREFVATLSPRPPGLAETDGLDGGGGR